LFNKLERIQEGLQDIYRQNISLQDQVLNIYQDIKEYKLAIIKPADIYEGICAELRNTIGIKIRLEQVH
jgi:hypothetical protein